MLRKKVSIPFDEDCFYRMKSSLEEQEPVKSRLAVLHSRYSSSKDLIKDKLAHPHYDEKERIAIFHNGFIANYEDFQKFLKT